MYSPFFSIDVLQFLYAQFPVESCFKEKLCENVVAEVTARTITTIEEVLHYLGWTFLARRVGKNPSYYGAQSSSTDDVQNFLLETATTAVESLQAEGCIEVNNNEEILSTPLGLASTYFYLTFRTPKQMQLGIREAYKIIGQLYDQCNIDSSENVDASRGWLTTCFDIDTKVDEAIAAWMLYVMASTHEFDELPVRHNEDIMNEDLSKTVVWGPDTDKAILGVPKQHFNPEIFADPHTKCFLLIQAHLGGNALPISDYLNDTKTVLDSIPRLLAAMRFIAIHQLSANSLELMTQFTRVKQLLQTRSLVNTDPLYQLPGFSHGKESKTRLTKQWPSIFALREMTKQKARQVLNPVMRNLGSSTFLDQGMQRLYAIPRVSIKNVNLSLCNGKQSNSNESSVILDLEFERDTDRFDKSTDGTNLSMTLLLGTYQRRLYLSEATLSISRFGKWTISKELSFQWDRSNADAGKHGELLRVRILWESFRGLDQEVVIFSGSKSS
jgi:hypothetical protein